MSNAEIPYHPKADLSKDSLIRIHSCVVHLQRLLDVATEWIGSSGSQDQDAAGRICRISPPSCLTAIRNRIERTLRDIDQGMVGRPSTEFARTITTVARVLERHEQEFRKSCVCGNHGDKLAKALSEAETLRDRIADR